MATKPQGYPFPVPIPFWGQALIFFGLVFFMRNAKVMPREPVQPSLPFTPEPSSAKAYHKEPDPETFLYEGEGWDGPDAPCEGEGCDR